MLSSFHDNFHSMLYHALPENVHYPEIMVSTQKLQVDGEGNIEGVQRELTNYCRLCQAFRSAIADRPF